MEVRLAEAYATVKEMLVRNRAALDRCAAPRPLPGRGCVCGGGGGGWVGVGGGWVGGWGTHALNGEWRTGLAGAAFQTNRAEHIASLQCMLQCMLQSPVQR